MAESAQAIQPSAESTSLGRRDVRPTTREWIRHSILLLTTIVSTTIAGVMFAPGVAGLDVPMPDPVKLTDYLLYVPQYYLLSVWQLLEFAIKNPQVILQGLTFSGSLLGILMAHEMGHYIACRRYGVSATLPFFIPAPPLFLAGTFGAFIKIRTQIPSRRALFDIGLAGPLAGFVVALPVALVGILSLQPAHGALSPITFNDPLLFRLLAGAFHIRLDNAAANPFYVAAWIGLL